MVAARNTQSPPQQGPRSIFSRNNDCRKTLESVVKVSFDTIQSTHKYLNRCKVPSQNLIQSWRRFFLNPNLIQSWSWWGGSRWGHGPLRPRSPEASTYRLQSEYVMRGPTLPSNPSLSKTFFGINARTNKDVKVVGTLCCMKILCLFVSYVFTLAALQHCQLIILWWIRLRESSIVTSTK